MKTQKTILLLLALLTLTLSGCGGTQVMTVGGPGMLPALVDGDKVVVDKTAYSKAEPQRGDIIAFKDDKGRVVIKRVVALPGETVEIKDKQVFIDGNALEEGYLKEEASTETTGEARWQVPENSVFVLGDNRTNSADSRAFGPVAYGKIIGKVSK